MITREQVDALRFGQIVRFEMPGREPFIGPVENINGAKVIGGTWLTDSRTPGDSYAYFEHEESGSYRDGTARAERLLKWEVATGYTESVLRDGTLTLLPEDEQSAQEMTA